MRDMLNVPYDEAWPEVFEELKVLLQNTLGDLALAIEHVGSTAIPGIPAKPRIDLDVVIESEELLPQISEQLETLGYFQQGNLGRAGREAFGRKDDQVPYDGSGREWMKHNLYVCPKDSPVLREHLLFRDYLRSHPEIAKEYADLKQSLVEEDRYNQDAYVAGKTGFVAKVLELAKVEE